MKQIKDNEYTLITEEVINNFLKDLMYKPSVAKKQNIILYTWEDENGKCQFLEEFDKAIKEYTNNINSKPFASEEHRQAYINSLNNK